MVAPPLYPRSRLRLGQMLRKKNRDHIHWRRCSERGFCPAEHSRRCALLESLVDLTTTGHSEGRLRPAQRSIQGYAYGIASAAPGSGPTNWLPVVLKQIGWELFNYPNNTSTPFTTSLNDIPFPATRAASSCPSSRWPSPNSSATIHGPARGFRYQSASNR